MSKKIAIYKREVRDYYNGETSTQYFFEPQEYEARTYEETDCLAVALDATELAGYFTPADGVVCEIADTEWCDKCMFVQGRKIGYTAYDTIVGVPAADGYGHYRSIK